MQVLLNANSIQLSALRYGDAKTLPSVDVMLRPGLGSVVSQLLPGIRVAYNSGTHGYICCLLNLPLQINLLVSSNSEAFAG